jgi:pyrrolidone-carboxylate peptidase
VIIDTTTPLGWQQHQANLAFARDYQPSASVGARRRKRVLVTGFGRFRDHLVNASGLVVSELVSGFEYPYTSPPDDGEIDPPEAQTAVAVGTTALDGVGEVDVCAMVLPVFWDLAAVLVLAEIAAFEPDFVVMNGIRSSRQPLWLELGAVNRAGRMADGSKHLRPIDEGAPLVPLASARDAARGNLASWRALRKVARTEIARRPELQPLMPGAQLAGFPRAANTYLCNNTAYVVGYLLDHPGETVRLLEASRLHERRAEGLDLRLDADLSRVPRLFIHWPGAIDEDLAPAGADVLRAIVGAQLAALEHGERPSRGHNAMADVGGGETTLLPAFSP